MQDADDIDAFGDEAVKQEVRAAGNTENITSNVNIPGYEGQALMRRMTAKRSGQHSAY
jgi:hypothetical protein